MVYFSSENSSLSGLYSKEKLKLPKEKKSCLPTKGQVLKATLVVLGVLALIVGAGLLIHYTVGFKAALHWMNTTHITAGQGLLYIGLPILGTPLLIAVAVKVIRYIQLKCRISHNKPIILASHSNTDVAEKLAYAYYTGNTISASEYEAASNNPENNPELFNALIADQITAKQFCDILAKKTTLAKELKD